MNLVDALFEVFKHYRGLIEILLMMVLAFLIFSILLRVIRRTLIKKAKSRKQKSNVTVFTDLLKYIFLLFLIIIGLTLYSGELGDLGFIAGLLTVALGWALQKPISGVVAWLILVTRRPFHIGDRVLISNMIGDVTNITLTHIFLDEVGGTIDGEEGSGRTIMIPTSVIFEQDVVNYTQRDDYIKDEVVTSITYESDLRYAEEVITAAFQKTMKPYWEKYPKRVDKSSHIRLMFRASGIDVTIRYMTIANKRNEITTALRREIWKKISANPLVSFAYPHTEVVMSDKIKKKM